jgi:hypothetical protein
LSIAEATATMNGLGRKNHQSVLNATVLGFPILPESFKTGPSIGDHDSWAAFPMTLL